MLKKINDKKQQNIYLQYLHKGLIASSNRRSVKNMNYYNRLPLSLRFYCDPPKQNRSVNEK